MRVSHEELKVNAQMQLIGPYGGYNGESGDWAHNLYLPPRHEAILKELSLRLLCHTENSSGVIGKRDVSDIEAAIHLQHRCNASKVAERDDEMVQINAEFDFAKDALLQVALRLRGDLFEREGALSTASRESDKRMHMVMCYIFHFVDKEDEEE
ncbi:hypothetical protein Tco_1409924 [Tanacetum coccineum]